MNHLHRRRAAAGIPHIRLRIVNDHRIRFFDEIHLVAIDVDTVTEKSLRSKDIPIVEAVDDALAMFL